MVTRTLRIGTPQPAVGACSLLVLLILGCASPGQPRPPSLKLPQRVDDLVVQRVGDSVHLRWTTPSQTTDNLPVPAEIFASVCRTVEVPGRNARASCVELKQFRVQPSVSEIDDPLPASLATGPAGLLGYRVEISNSAGKSAGRSEEAFAASGGSAAPVEGLRATPVRKGIRLQWTPQPGTAWVEIDRVPSSGAVAPPAGKPASLALLKPSLPTGEVHLSAGGVGGKDEGGAVDRSAQKGETYRYTAERVQTAVVGGHTLELRSGPSAPVTVKLLDTFPPAAPAGLEAAPGLAAVPSIDLSWRPSPEADLVGYNVYRSDAGQGETAAAASWQRLNAAPLPTPAFNDLTVTAGRRYAYRVTAVDTDGNESAPGNVAQEMPGSR